MTVHCSYSLLQCVQIYRFSHLLGLCALKSKCPSPKSCLDLPLTYMYTCTCIIYIQWSPSKTDTIGEVKFVLYKKVSLFRGFLNSILIHFWTYTNILYGVSLIWECHFRGVLRYLRIHLPCSNIQLQVCIAIH